MRSNPFLRLCGVTILVAVLLTGHGCDSVNDPSDKSTQQQDEKTGAKSGDSSNAKLPAQEDSNSDSKGESESTANVQGANKPHDTLTVNPNKPNQNIDLSPNRSAGPDENGGEGAAANSKVHGSDPGFESPLAEIPVPTQEEEDEEDEPREEVHTIEIPANWKRLGKEHEIWIDTDKKQVIAGGVVCLDRGGLEMFICPLYTKEHESVIAVNAMSSQVHAALLALGVKPGKPVQWEPEYQPVSGDKLKIEVLWMDGDKRVTKNSKELVRNFETKKGLELDWVFGGSQIYKDKVDGSETYLADSGELVCVSNFSTAAIDLPVESSNSNGSLMFEAFTENLPPRGTKVYVIFQKLE